MKILIMASNPRQDLNLDREIRDLKAVIGQSANRQRFEVEDALAVRVGDLQALLLQHRPQIVHFCGHGSGQQGLVFEGSDGSEQWVRAEALADLFRLFAQDVGCVLLNACYSETQADAIVTHIDYVIGMSREIRDDAAIAFSKGFYRGLGHEWSVEQSFELGCNAIQLEISGSSKRIRSADPEEVRKAEVVRAIEQNPIPEHLKPILKIRRSQAMVSNSSLTPEGRTAIQLEVAESLMEFSAADQYRAKVREFLVDRKLSVVKLMLLEQERLKLGLLESEANRILAEEQEPIQKAKDNYKQILFKLIETGHYPFNDDIKADLEIAIRNLGLTPQEVETITQPIVAAAEEDYQQRLAIEQQERDAAKDRERQQAEALKRQREEQQRKELERQRQEAERLQQEELKRKPKLISFEFEISSVEKQGLFRRSTTTSRQGRGDYFVEDLGNGIQLKMVAIKGGRFTMGSPESEQGRFNNEGPQHPVSVGDFFMGRYPVTQAQWRAVASLPQAKIPLNPDPSAFKVDNRPVERVSWDEAVEFCDRISVKSGRTYRLPSEAEWEYACRAGTTTRFYFGDDETQFGDFAWYDKNSRSQTHPVGGKKPNAWGLYDMHGNIWEWCQDAWHENYQGAPTDGSPWLDSIRNDNHSHRLLRGGSWIDVFWFCRSAHRFWYSRANQSDDLGFRVVSSSV